MPSRNASSASLGFQIHPPPRVVCRGWACFRGIHPAPQRLFVLLIAYLVIWVTWSSDLRDPDYGLKRQVQGRSHPREHPKGCKWDKPVGFLCRLEELLVTVFRKADSRASFR